MKVQVMKNYPKIELPKKPEYVKCAQDIDVFELFQKIETRFENCFLLESLGEYSNTSRYSVIGFDPQNIIRAKQNKLIIDDKQYQAQNPYYALREVIPQNHIARQYAGGLVGYISYEAVNYFEPVLNVKAHPDFDQFMFGVYADGLVLDKMTGEIFYFFYERNRLDLVKQIICSGYKRPDLKVKSLGYSLTKEEHKKGVEKIKEEIKSGNTFQCQLGFKANYLVEGDALQIYEKLRQVNPSPHMFYIKFGDVKLIGASPELLFRLQEGEMETFPLAGTTNRGKTLIEDMRLARKLLNDPKERAEHNMLVDLHRNDIGRVAEFGSVRVKRLMEIKKFSHVQHISSEITGKLKRGEDMFSALASNFPAGTLSGAPKIESIKIIDQVESEPRGPYGGAVGQFGFNGDCTFAIPIRSLFIRGGKGYTQASGGIVYDSKADKEYEEIQKKLAAMSRVLEDFISTS